LFAEVPFSQHPTQPEHVHRLDYKRLSSFSFDDSSTSHHRVPFNAQPLKQILGRHCHPPILELRGVRYYIQGYFARPSVFSRLQLSRNPCSLPPAFFFAPIYAMNKKVLPCWAPPCRRFSSFFGSLRDRSRLFFRGRPRRCNSTAVNPFFGSDRSCRGAGQKPSTIIQQDNLLFRSRVFFGLFTAFLWMTPTTRATFLCWCPRP